MTYEQFPDYRAMEYNEQQYRDWEKNLSPLEKLQILIDESKKLREQGVVNYLE